MKITYQIIKTNNKGRNWIVEEFETREEAEEVLMDMAFNIPWEAFHEELHGAISFEEYSKYKFAETLTKEDYDKMILRCAYSLARMKDNLLRGKNPAYIIRELVEDNSEGIYAVRYTDEEGNEEVLAYTRSKADAEEFLMSLWEEEIYEEFTKNCLMLNDTITDAIERAFFWAEEYKDKNIWAIEKVNVLP